MKTLIAAAAVAIIASSLATPSACLAAPDGEASLVLRFDDLDLSTWQGVNVLRQRVERAADQVCVKAAGLAPGGQMDLACRADALAAAHAQVPQAIAEQRLNKSRAVAEAAPR